MSAAKKLNGVNVSTQNNMAGEPAIMPSWNLFYGFDSALLVVEGE